MKPRPSPKRINTELERLKEKGEVFTLQVVASRLNCTPQHLGAVLRQRDDVVCVTPRGSKNKFTQWQFTSEKGV